MNGLLAPCREYAAPHGARSSSSVWFSTKMPRLTALPAHTGERSGAAAQRRRRGISVGPGNPFFKAPAGRHIWSISLTCCASVFYALSKRHSPYRAGENGLGSFPGASPQVITLRAPDRLMRQPRRRMIYTLFRRSEQRSAGAPTATRGARVLPKSEFSLAWVRIWMSSSGMIHAVQAGYELLAAHFFAAS